MHGIQGCPAQVSLSDLRLPLPLQQGTFEGPEYFRFTVDGFGHLNTTIGDIFKAKFTSKSGIPPFKTKRQVLR